MKSSSKYFYDSKLIAAEAVSHHLLRYFVGTARAVYYTYVILCTSFLYKAISLMQIVVVCTHTHSIIVTKLQQSQ